MGNHRLNYGGLAALVACLALVACGDVGKPTAPGTLEIASLPTAEVFVDGTSQGTTPVTIEIKAGAHDVKIHREYFNAFETKVDVGSGQASDVTAVLKPLDPTDAEALAIIAESYMDADDEVAFEAYEEPARHRGRTKAVLARLLWPQDEVREQGLSTFCLEATLDYMGDGFITFKKGRKVLYREPFEPDYEVTVAEIPAVVRDALKTNDTVSWGITFDDRRKPVMAKFKVVKRPKVERKLAKLEKDRNFNRLDPVSQDLLRADVLLRYRLYSEALVEHLTIHQNNPTSAAPYQGIVKALRRLDDGDETNLWIAALPEAGGGGRYARPPSRTGASGGAGATTVPQPGVPAPTVPGSAGAPGARPAPADAEGTNRPLRPSDQAPAAHLALWSPSPGARPDEAPVVPQPESGIVAPTAAGEQARPATGDVSESGLRQKVEETTREFLSARAEADAGAEELQGAQETAREAEEKANLAQEEARRARDEADAAVEAASADPSGQTQEHTDEMVRAADDARAKAEQARVAAEEARARAEGLAVENREAQDRAAATATAMQSARAEAEANGVAVGPVPQGDPGVGRPTELPSQTADKREAAIQAAQQVAEARQKYESLRLAAERTGDPDLTEEAQAALEAMQAAEKVAGQALASYHEAGGEAIPEIEEHQGTANPEAGVKAVLAERVGAAKGRFQDAQNGLAVALKARDENPGHQGLEDAVIAAEAELAEAEAVLKRAAQLFEELGGD